MDETILLTQFTLLRFFFFFIVFLVTSCKQKTDVRVKLINAALNENVANATIVLVEKKGESGGGMFGGQAECKEIATAVTDNNGECFFSKEKLKNNPDYKYYCAVTESWGIIQGYTCGGKTSGFLEKGRSQEFLINDTQQGFLEVQMHNLLNPSIRGDSLVAEVYFLKYFDPVVGEEKGGGRPYIGMPSHGDNGYPYPSKSILPKIKTPGGRYSVRIQKKKLGVWELILDTIKIIPNQTKRYTITW